MSAKCIRIDIDKGESDKKQGLAKIADYWESDTPENSVRVRIEFSSLNFKDALAITGKGKILRRFPLVPGIDFSGEIIASRSLAFPIGMKVLGNGSGLGETYNGGFTQELVVPEDILVPLPDELSTKEAMVLGTAGFTAGLCLQRFQDNNQTPEKGPILITGASGGVGSIATQILSQNGFEVHAVSGRKEHYNFLFRLGAKEVSSPEDLKLGVNPLERARFGGAIDNVGAELLSKILRHIDLWGNIASVGLVAGPEFSGTVMPHILRGVSLLGISSANCPMPLRKSIWQRLAKEWKPHLLSEVHTKTISLEEVLLTAPKLLERQYFGRVLVDCSL